MKDPVRSIPPERDSVHLSVVLFALLTITTCTLLACDKSPTGSQLSFPNRMQAALDQALLECPYRRGVSVAVIGPDGNVWSGVSGVSDPMTSQPITQNMLFHIGWSTSELYTTALILLYQEEEILSIDDPISTWLYDYRNVDEDAITVRHLLRHSSGLYDYLTNPSFELSDFHSMNHRRTWTPDVILNAFLETPLSTPGTGWSQSNTDYLLLRMIIDTVSESERVEEFRNRLFTPLGLDKTFIEYFETIPAHYPIAHGWFWNSTGNNILDISSTPRVAIATAVPQSMFSTAEDLAKWLWVLFEGQVLSQVSLDMILDFQSTGSSNPAEYGLGIGREYLDGEEYWTQGSWDFGYETTVVYSPDYHFCISVMCNFHGPSVGVIYPALLQIVLDEFS